MAWILRGGVKPPCYFDSVDGDSQEQRRSSHLEYSIDHIKRAIPLILMKFRCIQQRCRKVLLILPAHSFHECG